MTLIPWYYKAGAGLLILVAYTAFIWHLGGQSERLDAAQKENKALSQAIADNAKANDERRAAQKKADELAKPQREVAKSAKANPSGCDLAKPTGDKLREQARSTNDAIRSVR